MKAIMDEVVTNFYWPLDLSGFMDGSTLRINKMGKIK